jgi:CheY-like chemotaxis protein/anti-sigma regulatory factor (Ser/Thr protein kinase)
MFRLQATKKGITFSFDRAENLSACVYTDETRLRQILINLLSNAVKFTRRGGVTLRVRRLGAVTQFEIEDTGIGIGADDLGRIFEPFERIENKSGPAVPGVGLGLTITKLLTEILGGEISVVSRPGEGSCFRVRLLLAEVTRPATAPAARRRITGYVGRRRVVIAADDDATHRALLDETLSPLGIELLTVPDSPSCLRLASECRPDAFILDISMPGMDGWQLARQLREGVHENACIIVVSAHPDDPSARLDERRLHDAFLAKPLDLDALLNTLGEQLGLEWTQEAQPGPLGPLDLMPAPLLPHLDQLAQLVDIGHVSGLRVRLDELAAAHPSAADFIARMRAAIDAFRLDDLASMITTARREAA